MYTCVCLIFNISAWMAVGKEQCSVTQAQSGMRKMILLLLGRQRIFTVRNLVFIFTHHISVSPQVIEQLVYAAVK